ncbi:3-dehydroquinate synthase family protein [Lacunimicrobium album]
MPATSLNVSLGDRSYHIHITTDGIDALPGLISDWLTTRLYWHQSSPKGLIITDDNVSDHALRVQSVLAADKWSTTILTLPAGEQTKSLAHLASIYTQLTQMHVDRKTMIFAVGGGVIGDLAGFAAATYARGLPFVQIPTTLLSNVDSSVGGKTGINLPEGKNLVGAFHQPLGVFIDTSFMETLPDREFRSGLAEIVKYGVIMDAKFFAYLEHNIDAINRRDAAVIREMIQRSCQCKAEVVEQDEFERSGLRAILNYGHTFAHAYEALCGYGLLLHGEAVAIGMLDASRLAEKLKRIPADVTKRQRDLLTAIGLPTILPSNGRPDPQKMIDVMRLDKKSVAGKLRFILPTKLGHVELVKDIPEQLVVETLNESC